MKLPSLLRRFPRTAKAPPGRRNRPAAARKPAPCRLGLEALEDRTVPASLTFSSYLPGTAWATAVDRSGNVYATGGQWGSGAFVAKLNATGTALDWLANLGTNGVGTGIAVDGSGNVYVSGWSGDSAFPTTANALATTMPTTTNPGFLTVLNPSGSLLYSTWLPGSREYSLGANRLNGEALAIAPSGDGTGSLDDVYLTGTAAVGLPTTAGAYQTTLAGSTNAFFLRLDPNLAGSSSVLYGSYLGGGGNDEGSGIAVDGSGNAYLTGRTTSTNFPTTPGAVQRANGGGLDVLVAKFNPSLSGTASLVYSSYLGGSGSDGFMQDYFQSLQGWVQPGPGIAVDSAGDAYVTGTTTSANFPTTPGAFQRTYHAGSNYWQQGDAFVTKVNPTGTALIYSTYLGGNDTDGGASIAVDTSGNAYVTGWTRSTNFPTMNPIQAQKAGGVDSRGYANSDVFVTTLNSAGNGLLFSTFFGGPGGTMSKKGVFTGSNGDEYGYALALDSAGNAYVVGSTTSAGEPISTSFPTTAGAYDKTPGSGFVFMIDPPADGATPAPLTAVLGSGVLSRVPFAPQTYQPGVRPGSVRHDPAADRPTAAAQRLLDGADADTPRDSGSGPDAATLQAIEDLFADPASAEWLGGPQGS